MVPGSLGRGFENDKAVPSTGNDDRIIIASITRINKSIGTRIE